MAFQSPVNGEVWWDPEEDGKRGVCARPMARRYRSGASLGQVHGYRGKQYTLVARDRKGKPATRHAPGVALVQIWKATGGAAPPPAPAGTRGRKRSKKKEALLDDDDAATKDSLFSLPPAAPTRSFIEAALLAGDAPGGWSPSEALTPDPPRRSLAPPPPPSSPWQSGPRDADGSVVVDEPVRFLRGVRVDGDVRGGVELSDAQVERIAQRVAAIIEPSDEQLDEIARRVHALVKADAGGGGD